jgi:hypothetical protein
VNKQCPNCTCPIWDVNTVTAHMTHTLAVWLKRMPSPVSNVSTGETGHAERTARRPKQQGRWPASSERQPTAGRHAILPDGILSTCPLPKRSYIGGGRLPQLEGQMEGRAFASWCGVLLDSALLHLFLLLLEFLLPPVVDTVSTRKISEVAQLDLLFWLVQCCLTHTPSWLLADKTTCRPYLILQST